MKKHLSKKHESSLSGKPKMGRLPRMKTSTNAGKVDRNAINTVGDNV